MRSVLRFAWWPNRRMPRLPKREIDIDADRSVRETSRFARFVFGLAPKHVALQVVASVLQFGCGVALVELLARYVSGAASVKLWWLVVLALAQAALVYVQSVLAAALMREVHGALVALLASADKPRPLETLQRLLTRDLDLAYDQAPEVHKLVAFPLSAIGAMVFLLATYGPSDLAGYLGIGLFAPVSLLIAFCGSRLSRSVMATSETRIERTAAWIHWASYLLDWNLCEPLGRIKTLLRRETRLRNLDSVVRSSEVYLVLFGRVAPLAVAALIGTVTGRAAHASLGGLWVSGIVIALVLELGRVVSELRQGQIAYDALRRHGAERMVASTARTTNGAPLVITSTWDIWGGTLADNLIDSERAAGPLLEALGLVPELGANVEAAMARRLAPLGADVSAGQRLRILIARGALIAAAQRRLLFVDVPLSSLDAANRARALAVIADPFGACRARSTGRSAVAKSLPPIPDPPAVRVDAERRFAPRMLLAIGLFLGPACGLSIVGSIAARATDDVVRHTGLMAGVAFASVVLAVVVGWTLERHVRAWSAHRVLTLLRSPYGLAASDLVQRTSRDAAVVMERIAWYLHDVAWIVSLLVLSALTLIGTMDVLGGAVITFAVGTTALVWRALQPTVVRARTRSVSAHNDLLCAAKDLSASAHLVGDLVDGRRHRVDLVAPTFTELLEARIEMTLSKLGLARSVELVGTIAVITIAAAVRQRLLSLSIAAFILTAGLAVLRHALQLLLALVGYVAQRISLARLGVDPVQLPENDVRTNVTADAIGFLRSTNRTLDIVYPAVSFPTGRITSLVGPSGSGKTQMMRTLARLGHPSSERDGVYYLDEAWDTIVGWASRGAPPSLVTFLAALDRPRVVFLDEVFRHVDEDDARRQLLLVEGWARREKVAVVLADHRIAASEQRAVADSVLTALAS